MPLSCPEVCRRAEVTCSIARQNRHVYVITHSQIEFAVPIEVSQSDKSSVASHLEDLYPAKSACPIAKHDSNVICAIASHNQVELAVPVQVSRSDRSKPIPQVEVSHRAKSAHPVA